MTHASLKYAQLLTQGEIFQGDLFMPTKYQRDRPKNDHDCVQHSGRKCVGFVDENQPPTRQMDFGEAQAMIETNIPYVLNAGHRRASFSLMKTTCRHFRNRRRSKSSTGCFLI
jgi:hypothetical protein